MGYWNIVRTADFFCSNRDYSAIFSIIAINRQTYAILVMWDVVFEKSAMFSIIVINRQNLRDFDDMGGPLRIKRYDTIVLDIVYSRRRLFTTVVIIIIDLFLFAVCDSSLVAIVKLILYDVEHKKTSGYNHRVTKSNN
jgi:hypothetical protein